MKDYEVMPDLSSYTAAVTTCLAAERYTEAIALYDEMLEASTTIITMAFLVTAGAHTNKGIASCIIPSAHDRARLPIAGAALQHVLSGIRTFRYHSHRAIQALDLME